MYVELVKVQSSNITHIGYDKAEKKLIVQFKGSGRYEFSEVPEQHYLSMLKAESIGKAFASLIRGQYEFQRVEEQADENAA